MLTLKPCHFWPLLFCVLNIQVHVPVIQQKYASHKYEYQLVLLLTCPYYGSETPKILRKCIYHILHFSTWYIHDYVRYWWPDFVSSIPPVRSISWCPIWVVSRNTAPAYYLLRILPTYWAVSPFSYSWCVPPRPNYWACPVLTYRQLFFVYYMRWPSRSYTCTSYHTFRSSFGRTA